MGAGSAEAAEKFKEISTAYAILSDPNKRRQYDLSGADADSMFESGMESVDLENLNSMMRVFGAMMTKLGVPIPTQVRACVPCPPGRSSVPCALRSAILALSPRPVRTPHRPSQSCPHLHPTIIIIPQLHRSAPRR